VGPPAVKARLAALAVLVVFAATAWRYAAGLQEIAAVGSRAPDFRLQDITGETFRLSELRGRPVLLNFWATWCPPCIEEAPALEALHQRYGDRLAVVGVDRLEAAPAVLEFRDRFGLTYPLLLDRDGAVGDRYGVRGLPETWLIDADGTARFHRRGAVTFEFVQTMYRQALGRSIDGDGVGPVPAGGHAFDLEHLGGLLVMAAGSGLAAADPSAGVDLAAPESWTVDPRLDFPVHVLARVGDGTGDAGEFWAATTDGVWVSRPAAGGEPEDWRPAGLQGRVVLGLALSPGDRTALAWVPDEGLYRWENDEWTYLETDLDPELGSLALAADPGRPGRWLAGYEEGLLESVDDGHTWRPIGPGRAVFDLYLAGEVLYLATDQGIWQSRDVGLTAEPLGSPMRAFTAVTGSPDGILWALAPNGDLYARDGQGTWQRQGGGPGGAALGAGEPGGMSLGGGEP